MRTLLFILCFLVWAFVHGCSKPVDGPPQPGQQVWIVSGKTYLVGSTDPLPSVAVKCGGIGSTSGSDGSFEIRGVPGGTQTLSGAKAGCIDYSQSIEIRADTRHNVFLGFQTANLTGFVTNSVDGPIKGAKVALAGYVNYTDISGLFQFSNVPRGDVSIHVTHPNYYGLDSSFSLTTSNGQFDLALMRDSMIQITQFSYTYVDESLPDKRFSLPDTLFLRGNGYDSLGQFHTGVRRFIYVAFSFPQIFWYPSVKILDGQLQLCTNAPYSSTGFQTFAVPSQWTYILSYNTQPAAGSLLTSGVIGDSTRAKYSTVIDTDGFNRLAAAYRATGQFFGVVIKGGGYYPMGIYSSKLLPNLPKLTIKVRY